MAGCQRLYQRDPKNSKAEPGRELVELLRRVARLAYQTASLSACSSSFSSSRIRDTESREPLARMHFRISIFRANCSIGIYIARLRYRFAYLLMAWSVRNTYSVTITGYASRHAISYSSVLVAAAFVYPTRNQRAIRELCACALNSEWDVEIKVDKVDSLLVNHFEKLGGNRKRWIPDIYFKDIKPVSLSFSYFLAGYSLFLLSQYIVATLYGRCEFLYTKDIATTVFI